MAHGLSALHADGGIHRNINAGNVYLDEKRRAKLGGYQCLKVRPPIHRYREGVRTNNRYDDSVMFDAYTADKAYECGGIMTSCSTRTCLLLARVSAFLFSVMRHAYIVQSILHSMLVLMEKRYSLRLVNQPQRAYVNMYLTKNISSFVLLAPSLVSSSCRYPLKLNESLLACFALRRGSGPSPLLRQSSSSAARPRRRHEPRCYPKQSIYHLGPITTS